MTRILGFLFLFSIVACGDSNQSTNIITADTAVKFSVTTKPATAPTGSRQYDFDSTYELSKEHQPFMMTGYFNADDILDTAILIRRKSTVKDALFIKHVGTGKSFLLKNGKDIGSDFNDFNWIGRFEVIKKGTKIWNNVVDGEILGEEQIPENKKITLETDGLFIHEDEGGGGGIIYFKNGKYVWVQHD